MDDINKTKEKSHFGMGIVYSFIFGTALGFDSENFVLGFGNGMSHGIIIGVIMI